MSTPGPEEWGDPEPFGEDEGGEPLLWNCPNPECSTQKDTEAKAAAHCVSEDGDSLETAENEPATDPDSPSEPRDTTAEERSHDGPDPARVRAAVGVILRHYHSELDREIGDHVGPCDHDSCGDPGTECDRPATARAYFHDVRGWTDETAEDARLGWAPPADEQDELAEKLVWDHGFSAEEIRATGLVHEDLSPKWQGRYALPYLDADGQPVYGISRCTDPADEGGGGAAGYDGHPADSGYKYDKHIKNKEYAHPPDEPIFGLGSVEDGEPLLVAGGIADAISLHQAGYPCVSPVTTVRFKGPDLRKIVHLAWERNIPRVYIVNDAEPPTSELKEFDGDAERISDALNIRPDGEGRKAAIANARDFTAANIPTFFVDLPRPASFKVDPDDAVLGGWGDFDAMLASATPAQQDPEYQKRVAEDDPRRVRRDGRLLTAAVRPLDGRAGDGTPVRSDAAAGASRTGVGRGRFSGSATNGSGGYEGGSELWDLTFADVAGTSNNDRGDNPAGHHGNSHGYYTTFAGGELGYDHKDKVTHNALTYLLVDAGERDAANAEGELSDREKYVAWRHAKDEGHIPADDPIPLPALFHVLVASDETEYEADDWVYRSTEDGSEVGTSDDDPRSFDADVRFGLPPGGFNTGLDLLDERDVDHGREHVKSGDGGNEREDETDPTDRDVTLEPGVAWRAANAVAPADLPGEDPDGDTAEGDHRTLDLAATDDGAAWRCSCCGGPVDVVRAVALDAGLADRCDEELADREYHEAYRRARREYGAPLPEYVDEATATERWDLIQGALSQLTHYHLDGIRSTVTGEGGDDAEAVLDPCWEDSASGQRVVAFQSGVFYCREHERVLDPLRFVALEEGMIAECDDDLAGEEFREAYAATRDRGAPLPRWLVGDPDHRAVLPPADELVGDDSFATDETGLDAARNSVEDLYRSLARENGRAHLLAALTSLGKTTAAVKTAADEPTLYLGPRKELQREVEETADEHGVEWMHLPVLAEDSPPEAAVKKAVGAVRGDGDRGDDGSKDLLRDREALLDASGVGEDGEGDASEDEGDDGGNGGAGEQFTDPAAAREAGHDSLAAARRAVERTDAAAHGGEDGEEIHLGRESCPTANGAHGPGWQIAVHVARELGHAPKEIHVDAERLFGEKIPCQHEHDHEHGGDSEGEGDHTDADGDCPYSAAWSRATDPERPIDLLIGSYGHGYVGGARTHYYNDEAGRTQLAPRTVAIDEFPGAAYGSSFGDEAIHHARWLAATLVEDVDAVEDLFAQGLWDDEWVRAWLHGDGDEYPAGARAADRLDAADACRKLDDVLGEARAAVADEDTTVVADGTGEAHETVVRDALDRLDDRGPVWTADDLAECAAALDAADLRPRTVLTRRDGGLLDELHAAQRAVEVADHGGDGDEDRDGGLDRGDGVLAGLVGDALDAARDGADAAGPLLDAARTAVRGGEAGCRELAGRASDPYAHPEAYLLLFGFLAREPEDGGDDGGHYDDESSVVERLDADAFGFDVGRDGAGLKRSVLDGATILADRDHNGAYVLDPPEFCDRTGAPNPVVGLDATGREELWSLALGEDVEREDIHESTADRRAFLRDVLNVQVVQTSPHAKFYEGSVGSKNFDPDVELVRTAAREFGSERIRRDRLAAVGKPGVITTKCVREEVEGRLDGHASVVDNYGNVTGSNALAGCRLGCVLGTQHYGDHAVEKWAALAGEQVARTGRGTGLDYGSETANAYLEHMSADQTMQAILRFGRDEGGAVVFAHTAALRDELPVDADAAVATSYSDTAREVRDAALDRFGPNARAGADDGGGEGEIGSGSEGDEAFTAADLDDDVDRSRRSIKRALDEFADLGYLDRHDPGPGRAHEYWGVEDPGVGEVELPSTETTEGPAGPEGPTADATLDSDHNGVSYTWFVGVRGASTGVSRPDPRSTATLPAPAVADGGDRPPDPSD